MIVEFHRVTFCYRINTEPDLSSLFLCLSLSEKEVVGMLLPSHPTDISEVLSLWKREAEVLACACSSQATLDSSQAA